MHVFAKSITSAALLIAYYFPSTHLWISLPSEYLYILFLLILPQNLWLTSPKIVQDRASPRLNS